MFSTTKTAHVHNRRRMHTISHGWTCWNGLLHLTAHLAASTLRHGCSRLEERRPPHLNAAHNSRLSLTDVHCSLCAKYIPCADECDKEEEGECYVLYCTGKQLER